VYSGFWWFEAPLALPLWNGDANPLRALAWYPLIDETSGYGVLEIMFWVEEPKVQVAPLPTAILPWRLTHTHQQAIEAVGAHYHRPHADRERRKFELFAAGLAFLEQQLLVAGKEQVERHTRRRCARQGLPVPELRVIRLRRQQQTSRTDVEHEPVDWSCQWIVRGHWRQQPYPSKHTTQPVWITPYVKGPEDKPLKPPRATVFAVVR
jgi:hypothetical protein